MPASRPLRLAAALTVLVAPAAVAYGPTSWHGPAYVERPCVPPPAPEPPADTATQLERFLEGAGRVAAVLIAPNEAFVKQVRQRPDRPEPPFVACPPPPSPAVGWDRATGVDGLGGAPVPGGPATSDY